jgi:hypothetical protein
MFGLRFWNWFQPSRTRPRPRPVRSRNTPGLEFDQLESRLTPSGLVTATQNFVAQAYLDVLQRPVDPPGLAFWSGNLNEGATPSAVVVGIEQSTEFRTVQVQSLYHRFLKRDADRDGLNTGLAFLQGPAADQNLDTPLLRAGGGRSLQLAASLLASPEYFQKNGGTNDGFLDGAYADVLGRAVDAAGRAGFDQLLAAGASRLDVATLILSSRESFQRQVEQHFETVLGRSADAAGLATLTALEGAAGDEAVIAAIVGSSESFQLAQQSTPSSTSLVASVNPSLPGQAVTFTATVSPAAGTSITPLGTVTFVVDGVAGQPAPLSGGMATLTTTTLPAGTHTITAIYNGNARFAGSSSTYTQAVNLVTPTATALTSSASGLIFIGTPVTFTATVSPSTSPGTVAFLVNGGVQQTVAVSNGMASYTTTSLPLGMNMIQADYTSSSPSFSSSASNVLTQDVFI